MSCTRQSLDVSLGAAVGSARPGSRSAARSRGRRASGAPAGRLLALLGHWRRGSHAGGTRDRANRRGNTHCDRRRRDTDVCRRRCIIERARESTRLNEIREYSRRRAKTGLRAPRNVKEQIGLSAENVSNATRCPRRRRPAAFLLRRRSTPGVPGGDSAHRTDSPAPRPAVRIFENAQRTLSEVELGKCLST